MEIVSVSCWQCMATFLSPHAEPITYSSRDVPLTQLPAFSARGHSAKGFRSLCQRSLTAPSVLLTAQSASYLMTTPRKHPAEANHDTSSRKLGLCVGISHECRPGSLTQQLELSLAAVFVLRLWSTLSRARVVHVGGPFLAALSRCHRPLESPRIARHSILRDRARSSSSASFVYSVARMRRPRFRLLNVREPFALDRSYWPSLACHSASSASRGGLDESSASHVSRSRLRHRALLRDP
jgi:hypothetical protein